MRYGMWLNVAAAMGVPDLSAGCEWVQEERAAAPSPLPAGPSRSDPQDGPASCQIAGRRGSRGQPVGHARGERRERGPTAGLARGVDLVELEQPDARHADVSVRSA